jgi:aminoglycoside 6'-N-acetyltransferase
LSVSSPLEPRLELRSLAPGDEEDLLRIHRRPEVVRWWDLPEEGFPWDEPESKRLTIVVDGKIAGLIQYWEEREPRYRHAGIDLFLDPSLHGQGFGAEAVGRVVRYLIHHCDHHRITIDPALANAAAIRCYEKVGFTPVGVMRRAERDSGGRGWHDCLLMELVVPAPSDGPPPCQGAA